jgi:hypothetical protein
MAVSKLTTTAGYLCKFNYLYTPNVEPQGCNETSAVGEEGGGGCRSALPEI